MSQILPGCIPIPSPGSQLWPPAGAPQRLCGYSKASPASPLSPAVSEQGAREVTCASCAVLPSDFSTTKIPGMLIRNLSPGLFLQSKPHQDSKLLIIPSESPWDRVHLLSSSRGRAMAGAGPALLPGQAVPLSSTGSHQMKICPPSCNYQEKIV